MKKGSNGNYQMKRKKNHYCLGKMLEFDPRKWSQDEFGTMPFIFVYRIADIYRSALSKLRGSAEISAVRYTNLNGIVY